MTTAALAEVESRCTETERRIEELETKMANIENKLRDKDHNKKDDAKEEESSDILSDIRNDSACYSKLIPILGEMTDSNPWHIRECGDGNINFIFIVKSKQGSVVVKKAPPYVRLVGPSWQLGQSRLDFEVKYFEWMEKVDSNKNLGSPAIVCHSRKHNFFAMEYLDMSVFRADIGKAREYPNMGQHVGAMLAHVLFKTSDLCLTLEEKWKLVSEFSGNSEMIALTEQVIFEEPYYEAPNNRNKVSALSHCPEMRDAISKLRADKKVISNVYTLRFKFRNVHEALLHGDYHTGSLMLNENRTVCIDAEFAMIGPMAFDVGMFIGNMILGVFGQELYPSNPPSYRKYLMDQIGVMWDQFSREFLSLWENPTGNLFPKSIIGKEEYGKHQQEYMRKLLQDTLKFASLIILRRCIGIADAAEFRVKDEKARLVVETKCIQFGHWLLISDSDSLDDTLKHLSKVL